MKTTNYLFGAIAILLSLSASSQSNTVAAGNWTNAANWSNGVPASSATSIVNHKMDINHDIEIASGGNYTINATSKTTRSNKNFDIEIKNINSKLTINATVFINGNLEIKDHGQLIVKSNDTLIIGGDAELGEFTFFESLGNKKIIVEKDGVIIIKGNLTVENATNVELNGTMMVEGNAKIKTFSDIYGNGKLQTKGRTKVELFSSVFGRYGNIFWDGCPGNCDYGIGQGLPIELSAFNAAINPDNQTIANIYWTTASEVNNNYFRIEHSFEGTSFETIAEVKGAGNSNVTLSYKKEVFIHKRGKHYFKLTQVDFDGKSESFLPVIIDNSRRLNDQSSSLKIFPNPSNGKNIKLMMPQLSEGTYNLVIFDSNGKNIHHKVFTYSTENYFKMEDILDGKTLQKGVYFLRIYNSKENYSEKIIVE